MARKKIPAEHINHERWLVSYADFITLLFAFFVVMFASSQADKGRASQVAESVRKALEDGFVTAKVAAMLSGTPAGAAKTGVPARQSAGPARSRKAEGPMMTDSEVGAAELLPSIEYLTKELQDEIKSGKMRISVEPRGLVISLSQAAFFPSGGDTIEPTTYSSIEKVAKVIRDLPNPVHLEGHTDSVPIHNSRFHSNWELSAARGVAMLDLLTEHFGIQAGRLAIAGYASNAPVDSNDSEAGRARNRRVDIVILNKVGVLREPLPLPRGKEGKPAAKVLGN